MIRKLIEKALDAIDWLMSRYCLACHKHDTESKECWRCGYRCGKEIFVVYEKAGPEVQGQAPILIKRIYEHEANAQKILQERPDWETMTYRVT